MVGRFEPSPDRQGTANAPLSDLYLSSAPRGWLYASAAAFSGALRQLETTPADQQHSLIASWPPPAPSASSRYRLYRAALSPGKEPYISSLARAPAQALRAQAQARLAMTACVLERHRLAEGTYPERLEALVPTGFASVPLDPIDGRPLRYARESNDRFRLWSLAIDARDDNGSMEHSPDVPLRSMDWVWSWP
ncbi:MAG: hypothetical protein KF833_01505 [Verrucomicrobiae bacterium]|nr:hypothetical protein [Verrucomicrobiae bacterium]